MVVQSILKSYLCSQSTDSPLKDAVNVWKMPTLIVPVPLPSSGESDDAACTKETATPDKRRITCHRSTCLQSSTYFSREFFFLPSHFQTRVQSQLRMGRSTSGSARKIA